MRWFVIRLPLFLILAVLLVAIPLAAAQDETDPLYLWSAGDLYSVADPTVAPVRLTEDGAISGPVGYSRWIAYKTASHLGREALDRVQVAGLIADFDLPADIALYNTINGTSQTIAAQPEGASLLVPGQPDRAIMRSAPSWAPNGSALAWIEIDYPTPTAYLTRYDIDSAATMRIASFSVPTLIPPPVLWGRGGIAVDLSADASSDQFHMIYNPADGALIAGVGVATVPGDSVRVTRWVQDVINDRPLFGMLYESGGWTLIDPATNTPIPYTNLPVLKASAGGSALVQFGVDASLGFYWEFSGTNVAAVGDPTHVTLNTNGTLLAVIGVLSEGKVSIFQGGDMTPIPGTGNAQDEIPVGSLIWGSPEWVITP